MIHAADKTVNFRGYELRYRDVSEKKCKYGSYMGKIRNGLLLNLIRPDTITPLTGIKLCHFSTEEPLIWYPKFNGRCLVSRYGEDMYKVSYTIMLKAYLKCRQMYSGRDNPLSLEYYVASVYTNAYKED